MNPHAVPSPTLTDQPRTSSHASEHQTHASPVPDEERPLETVVLNNNCNIPVNVVVRFKKRNVTYVTAVRPGRINANERVTVAQHDDYLLYYPWAREKNFTRIGDLCFEVLNAKACGALRVTYTGDLEKMVDLC
jgi:hypothetical protein